jgi:carnitine O-acetyltransferase
MPDYHVLYFGTCSLTFIPPRRIAYMINENSVQFNIVSKHLGCERMAFFLNEAAGDIRDMMSATMPAEKAKL